MKYINQNKYLKYVKENPDLLVEYEKLFNYLNIVFSVPMFLEVKENNDFVISVMCEPDKIFKNDIQDTRIFISKNNLNVPNKIILSFPKIEELENEEVDFDRLLEKIDIDN